MQITSYGVGGYCANCTPEHQHPLHNIVAESVIPDLPADPVDPALDSAAAKLKKLGLTPAEIAAIIGATP